MKSKYFIPATTMLSGFFIWAAFLVFHEVNGAINEPSPLLEAELFVLSGGLIFFSAVRCRRVGGPRAGNIVRTALLIVMAIVTYWRFGNVGAGVLAAAAVMTGVLLLMRTDQPEGWENPVTSSAQTEDKFD